MSKNLMTVAVGVVLVIVGLLLRFYGGETSIGPFELGTVGNVLWIVGAIEGLIAIGYIIFPDKKKKID